MRTQGGFIKKVTLVVVFACILFIVFASVAKYVSPTISGNIDGLGSIANTSRPASGAPMTAGGNNPLLGFLDNSSSGVYSGNGGYGSAHAIPPAGESPYAGEVSLGSGTASYAIQLFDEYVTLRNTSNKPVDITGWMLSNSKGTRPIQNSNNNYFYPSGPDTATIGQGTEFLDPSGAFRTGDIVLKPGDEAYVTTGGPFYAYPFQISTSFRENICEGYLKNYPFNPPLDSSCPYPTNDPAINTVTSECYDYMQSLNRCEDPERYDKDNFDLETTQCRAFMTARLSYPACVAQHRDDANFSMGEWRVFLGKRSKLWANQRETITLYDRQGLIVDRISY